MSHYFGTFMLKQAFKGHYIVIEADNAELAHEAMFNHFGEKFVTLYTVEIFEGQVEKYNLKEMKPGIKVIDHGYGCVEYKAL